MRIFVHSFVATDQLNVVDNVVGGYLNTFFA